MKLELQKPLKLTCPVRHYAWGRAAGESIIPSLLGGPVVDTPYAELWMGAHPSASSTVEIGEDRRSLTDLISQFPKELLGESVQNRFGDRLPFLLKVLSIRTALSIQAHPDKAKAEQLHAEDPAHYPDDNHKPEVAIPISAVSLLYGFRPIAEVAHWSTKVPEFAELLGQAVCQNLAEANEISEDSALLQQVYDKMFQAPAELVQALSLRLYARLAAQGCDSPEEEWILRLSKEYPSGDIGLFSFFVLNLAQRTAGEGVFIGPNIPHAYLEGELVECMANSDNVIRAGLTPKYKDVATLLEIADYSVRTPSALSSDTTAGSPVTAYQIPTSEFAISRITGSFQSVTVGASAGVEMLFCLDGSAALDWSEKMPIVELHPGSVYLLPACLPAAQVRSENATLFHVSIPEEFSI